MIHAPGNYIMTQVSKLNKAERRRLLLEHRGVLKRVADRLGVDQSLVSRVFHRKARSRKVLHALQVELERLEKHEVMAA
jgi:hypothetical protein